MKIYARAIVGLLFVGTLFADQKTVFSRSFMFTRPASYQLSTQQALWHDLIYNKRGPVLGSFQAIAFYQQSIPNAKNTEYFMPSCKQTILIAGDNAAEPYRDLRNVRAEWLGLNRDFVGTFSMKPKQWQTGITFEYNQDLKKFFDIPFVKEYWVDIALPIIAVENNLHPCQFIINPGTPTPKLPQPDILHALDQPRWLFSKIKGKQHKVRPAELRFTLGSSLVSKDYFQFAFQSILVAPLGNKPDPEFLFSPLVGNAQHAAIGGTIFLQFPLNRDTDYMGISYFVNFESLFLIRNHQQRTFDLIGRPWSRYMTYNERLGNDRIGEQNIPGVNVLTRHVVVHPYGIFELSTGWRIKKGCIEGEFGFDIWGKGPETLILHPKLLNNVNSCNSCYGEFAIAGSAKDTSASRSTIDTQAPDDPIFTPIQESETYYKNYDSSTYSINLQTASGQATIFPGVQEQTIIGTLTDRLDMKSAASPGVVNYKLHFSIGSVYNGESVDSCFGAGCFIDMPGHNSELMYWGAWLKGGVSF